jgi:hypothetical protein
VIRESSSRLELGFVVTGDSTEETFERLVAFFGVQRKENELMWYKNVSFIPVLKRDFPFYFYMTSDNLDNEEDRLPPLGRRWKE